MPIPHKSLGRRIAQGFGLLLAALLLLLVLSTGALALWLSRADLKPIVENAASEQLGRRVTLGSLTVHWGNPLAIDVTDLSVANPPWGSEPEMARVGRLSALVDLGPLLQGVLRYERLRMADATILLERDAKGVGNWAFGNGESDFPLVPRNRTEFPSLIDFNGERGRIVYRTRSGQDLQIELDHVAIFSPGEETPARLLAQGAYGNVPARLDASTDSYATLRDATVPFGARLTLQAPDTDIAFNGRLWEPLDFDGVRGEFSMEAGRLDDILGLMNLEAESGLPLSVAGILGRDGDDWSLAAAKGQVQQSGFSGNLTLREGEPGDPDHLGLDLDFSTLDLDGIAAALTGGRPPADLAAIRLQPHRLAGLNGSAALTALSARLGGRNWHAAALRGRLAGGEARLEDFSVALGRGTLSVKGTLAPTNDGGQLDLEARLSKASMSEIARELGGAGTEIRGRVDGRATLSMAGPTVGAALARSSGAAVITLRDGRIARNLVEELSTDLRSLFRETGGTVPVSCLLGVLTVSDGLGLLSPLRLESQEAIATGAGNVDLAQDKLDVTIRTERDSTDFFALDMPVRISGPFNRLSARPLVGGNEDWPRQPTPASRRLPPELHEMADGSPCSE